MKLVDVDAFRAAARKKHPLKDGLFRVSVGEPKAFDDGSRRVRFCFSDGSVDRMKDTISPEGWDTEAFMRNPVALFAHDSSAPPIGRASDVGVDSGRLMGTIEFAPAETYAFADTIYRLVLGNWLRACSVGFLPIEYDWSDDDDREWGMDFKRQELLEISVCPVPANGNALAEARAKGIDTRPLIAWAERTLDGGGKVIIPRTELERLRKAAKEPPVTRRAATKPRLRADGAGEDDPADGGTAVGNCGRPAGDECGMKDKSECSIHGQTGAGLPDDDDSKRIQALVDKAVAKALARKTKPVKRADEPPADEGGSDDPPPRPDVGPDHEKSIRMCAMHMKAMGDCLDVAAEHHDKAMDALDSVVEALDATPPASDGISEGDDPEGKAARLRRVADLRRRTHPA